MPKSDQTRLLRLLILTGLFLSAAGGAWAWYFVNPKQFPISYAFRATDRIPGHVFKPEAVGAEAVEILATTNLFNGSFTGPQGERLTAFMGTWDATDSKQMSVVGHTPDICWVGAGAVPVSVGHPDKLELQFQGERIPFEVRTFRMPNQQLELTAWCTLISGQVFSENDRFELKEGAPADSRLRQGQAGAICCKAIFGVSSASASRATAASNSSASPPRSTVIGNLPWTASDSSPSAGSNCRSPGTSPMPAELTPLTAQLEDLRATLDRCRDLLPRIADAGDEIRAALRAGHKLLTAGNGGSAADALHLAEELVGRFDKERPSLPAVSLCADPTLLTCIANDYGFERVFSRQVEGLGRPGDVLVVFSTSGNSPNLLAALLTAKARGLKTIALLGKTGGPAKGIADHELIVPSTVTARIQEVHTFILHSWLVQIEADHA